MNMLNLKLRKSESDCTLNQANTAKNKYSSLTRTILSFALYFPGLIFTLSGQIVVYSKTKKISEDSFPF